MPRTASHHNQAIPRLPLSRQPVQRPADEALNDGPAGRFHKSADDSLTSVQAQETNVGIDQTLFWSTLPPPKTTDFAPSCRIQKVAGRSPRSVWETIAHGYVEVPIEPATQVESNWWHHGHIERRKQVREALARTNQTAMRREAFEHCGSGCFVQHSPSTQRFRLAANFCHDRFCERCSRSRSRVIASNLSKKLEGKSFLHLILTLKHRAMPLSQQLTRLIRCFRSLRESRLWKQNVKGGVYFIELKLGQHDRLWHPHLHVAMQSQYIPQQELSNTWLGITGDSDIVYLKRYTDQGEVVRYVSKYAAKGIDRGIFDHPDSLDEAVCSLKGRRLWSTFGSWRDYDLDSTGDNPSDWKTVCSLDKLWSAANRGELWATGLLKSLRKHEVDSENANAPP